VELYNINIAELIDITNKLEMRALINKMRINILVHADDISLVSPLRRILIDMLNATLDYMELWKIKKNVQKKLNR
jgi:UDP-N-acetyl-D-mannosaminuronic acid transferase (WecB/TagA/CpsF family)